jgi:hypothetical protein
VYQALNGSVGRIYLLRKDADFGAFRHDVIAALRRDSLRIPSPCVLSNHWCFVVWPETDGQVTKKKGVPCAPMAPSGSRGDVTRSGRCRATLSDLFQRRGAGMSALCRRKCQAVKKGFGRMPIELVLFSGMAW